MLIKAGGTSTRCGAREKCTGYPEASCHLTAAHKAQSLTELWDINKLGEAEALKVSRMGGVVFTRLIQIQILYQCQPLGHSARGTGHSCCLPGTYGLPRVFKKRL